jgi:hypothetical protein
MVKRRENEPADKAAERLKQLLDARRPVPERKEPEEKEKDLREKEQKPAGPAPDKSSPDEKKD